MASNHPTKGRTLPPEPLTREEAHRLMNAPSRRAPTGIRNKALLAVLYRAGLRISEALDLYLKDVDRAVGTLRVLHGKGNKSRTVGLDPETLALLERWLDVRASRGINGRQRLFCTLQGEPIKTAYVRALLPRLARKAGIEKRVHAHGLRHTMAAEMRAEGADIGVISKALGHSSIATTARYLDHVAPAAVVAAMRSRPWSEQACPCGKPGRHHVGKAVVCDACNTLYQRINNAAG
jgi:site-specific recombinase XerD